MDTAHRGAAPGEPAATECPYLGTGFSPLAGGQLEDPYSFYARAWAAEPVFFSPLFQMWFVKRRMDDRDRLHLLIVDIRHGRRRLRVNRNVQIRSGAFA
jgi:hypothetical protein